MYGWVLGVSPPDGRGMVPVSVESASDDSLASVCTATIGRELPFLITVNFADAKFLIGGNRPKAVIPKIPVNFSYAS